MCRDRDRCPSGLGGIGMTRLAVAVGERLVDRFGRRTAFVPLAAVTEPELVLGHRRPALDLYSPSLPRRPRAGDTRLQEDRRHHIAAAGPQVPDCGRHRLLVNDSSNLVVRM
jgi:hypothetical protein